MPARSRVTGDRSEMPNVPILMYHQVALKPDRAFRTYAVTPRAFAAQIGWLARRGYTAIDLPTFLAGRSGATDLPQRPVVISFDDGYRDAVAHAVPILQRHGFTATFFLVSGLVGGSSRWLRAEKALEYPLVDWPTARRIETQGFRCESHTVTHRRLAELDPTALEHELGDARRMLEDELGRAVEHLAYPHGAHNPTVRAAAAEAGYRSACTVDPGFVGDESDALALPRIFITGHDSLLDFVVRLRTTQAAGETVRRAARRAVNHLPGPLAVRRDQQ